MTEVQSALIYLLCCAVNGCVPDKARVQEMPLQELYELAASHSVESAVCVALERAGVKDERFHQAYNKNMAKSIYHDLDRKAILKDLEKQGIWYMPLKGILLKDIYPVKGMRQMADNDILFDPSRQRQVKAIMEAHGYKAKKYGRYHHDEYHKQPFMNFEMHLELLGTDRRGTLYRYYADVGRLLKKDADNRYGYHFSDEDFYVFLTVHEWRHYRGGGTGIRSLLDCYVYCHAKGDSLDWAYISAQMKQLGLDSFEARRRALAFKLFSDRSVPPLSDGETEMLQYYFASGAYGTLENRIRHEMDTQSKTGYLLKMLFPDMELMRRSVRFVNRCPALYPVGLVYRFGRAVFRDRKSTIRRLRTVRSNDNKPI